MNNPTKLLHTDIIAVEVPGDANGFENGYFQEESDIKDSLDFFEDKETNHSTSILIGFEFELLGEATETEISFDVESYVEKTDNPYWIGLGLIWIDYINDQNCFKTAKESFYSLLQASGLYWINPLGKDDFTDGEGLVLDEIAHKQWQEYESKVIKGKLIFLKPV